MSANAEAGAGKDGGPQVSFEHVNSIQSVKLHAGWDDTILSLWDEAYRLLGEPRRSDDRLQTDAGTDLMPHLAKTLRQLHDAKLVKGFKFQICGPTGGA